jgi:quercetin dioxygenase-like cupin family protein
MPVYKTSLSTAEYEPDLEHKEVKHYLRKSEPGERVLRAGFIIAQPEQGVPGSGHGDDNVFVLAGEAHVTMADGEKVVLKAGDFASFPKGTPQTWDIIEEFKVVFVYVE